MKTRRGKERRAHDRELALAYLGAVSADEMRLDQVIDDHIKRVLDATNQNLSLAADLLGMHRRSLQRYARRKQLRTRRAGKQGPVKRRAAKRHSAKTAAKKTGRPRRGR